MGGGRRSRVVRQNGERGCHLGQVQNNSTLGYPTKQPCAAALTSTLPALQFVLQLVSFFAVLHLGEGKATHPYREILFRQSTRIEATCCISTTQENNFRPRTP
jgi:hypothetical protein